MKHYASRGIEVCEEWRLEFEPFKKWAMENGFQEGLVIDREDNEKGYSKDNCRWSSRTVQNLNRRNNVLYELNGESKTLGEWSKINGIGRVTMLKRLQAGVPVEIALTAKGFCGYRRERKKAT